MRHKLSPRVCLVVPGHLTATPRLLKEAAALAAEGYRVHTVSLDNFHPHRALDDALLAEAPWTATRLGPPRGLHLLARRISHRLASRLPAAWVGRFECLANRAKLAESRQLLHATRGVEADYYIGHCLGSLSVVAAAAKHRNVGFGFDLEDFHEAETVAAERDVVQLTAARSLLKRHLPAAAHLTAAAPLIADAYRRLYRVEAKTVLNVFPLDHAPTAPIDVGPVSRHRPAILYWVSQTIGPGRGLEEIIATLAHVRSPIELHLRGHPAPGFTGHLETLARTSGTKAVIRFLPFSASREVVRLAATADLGLATELPVPLNRDLCLTNKVFIYPLAGVPQLISGTRAQTAFAPALGAAGLPFSIADHVATAAMIDRYLSSPATIAHARSEAWKLGQERLNWDVEQARFLDAFRAGLTTARASGAPAREPDSRP